VAAFLGSAQPPEPAIVAQSAAESEFASVWVSEHALVPVRSSPRYPAVPGGRIPAAVGSVIQVMLRV
jgi:hypothetical protein